MMFTGIVVYVCHDEKCHRLQPGLDNEPNIIRDMATLSCDHEEADTRMLLHANHASQLHGSIVICHILQCELFFETRLNEETRIIDVRCVQQQIGEKENWISRIYR